jgi:hypothetical protein
MIDEHGYPTEETLEKIQSFDPQKDDVYEFVEYLCENWVNGYPPKWNKKRGTLQLSTGGWSGCESVITALKIGASASIPWFWTLYWYQSRAGGHYWFRNIRRLRK